MHYIIAVDGSFQPPNTVVGAVVVANSETRLITKTAKVECDNEAFKSSRNVYGECAAALIAFQLMRLFLDNDPTATFTLVYDYEGIQKWIEGTWSAKKPLTTSYVRGYQICEIKSDKISFYNQKSHSGITDFYSYLNDTADRICNGRTQPEFVVKSNLGEF